MSRSIHFVIDFETLGLSETAIPLSLAITPFYFGDVPSVKKLIANSIEVKFNVKELNKTGMFTKDKSTIEWWKKQDTEVREAVLLPSEKDLSLSDSVFEIREFFIKSGYNYNTSYIWARGMDFDMPKLKHLFDVANVAYPFNPFKSRDIRTAIDIMAGTSSGKYTPKNKRAFDSLPKHIAISDTVRDAYILQELYLFGNENVDDE